MALKAFAGGRLFGARYGTGTVQAVALPGWQRTYRDFDEVLGSGTAGADIDAIALDLPGFGSSPPPSEPWGSRDYADAVLPVLEEIGSSVIVIGHSFGGRVALQLAANAPEHVRGVVLTGVPQLLPSVQRPRANWRYRAVRSLARVHLVSERRLEAARIRFGSADYRAASPIMRSVLVKVLQENYESELRSATMPIEMVWGSADTAAPLEMATAAASLPERCRLTVLDGVGHLVPSDAPAALRAALERLGC